MHTSCPYTIRRLLPADLKIMYYGREENAVDVNSNPFEENFECVPHEIKGGVRLTNFITYSW